MNNRANNQTVYGAVGERNSIAIYRTGNCKNCCPWPDGCAVERCFLYRLLNCLERGGLDNGEKIHFRMGVLHHAEACICAANVPD